MHENFSTGRRFFLKASALSAVTLTPALRPAAAATRSGNSGYTYEVTRTEDEWHARLNDEEYRILREFKTEKPHSHPNATLTDKGSYACRGCDLDIYESSWKVILDKGWAFFKHAQTDSVLTSIDGGPSGEGVDDLGRFSMIEAHCRRCGSHMGHILLVDGDLLHCINGTSLVFTPASA